MFYVNIGQIGKYEFCLKKSTFPNFLGGILLVCYKGCLSRTNPVEKASVAICSVKKHKMPVGTAFAPDLINLEMVAPPVGFQHDHLH